MIDRNHILYFYKLRIRGKLKFSSRLYCVVDFPAIQVPTEDFLDTLLYNHAFKGTEGLYFEDWETYNIVSSFYNFVVDTPIYLHIKRDSYLASPHYMQVCNALVKCNKKHLEL